MTSKYSKYVPSVCVFAFLQPPAKVSIPIKEVELRVKNKTSPEDVDGSKKLAGFEDLEDHFSDLPRKTLHVIVDRHTGESIVCFTLRRLLLPFAPFPAAIVSSLFG